MPSSRSSRLLSAAVLTAAVFAFSSARATETTVQNDSLDQGGFGIIEAGFAENESAAAWLTSPCTGNIVAVQILWRSNSGTAGQVLGDNITVYTSGTFPIPGDIGAFLEGPVLTDGFINEYRYLDENQTIPLSVPVVTGQKFVVSFRFGQDTDPEDGPSVVVDTNGCQNGKNAIDANGFGWINACSLGVSGDFVIRAVVDCQDPQGACCLPGDTCQLKTQSQCTSASGTYRGNGTVCDANSCVGACCDSAGNCTQQTQSACTSSGGTFKPIGTACTATTCKGACCLANGSCADGHTPTSCAAAGGVYKGDGTLCSGVICTGACCSPQGVCTTVSLATCNANGGTWNGPATNCSNFSCTAIGACCKADGTCVANQTQTACTAAGGNWDGAGTVCGANGICERACCFSGGCVDLTKSDCDSSAGTWQGVNYHCTGSNCPTGACCLPLGTCIEAATPVQCAAQNGVFHLGQTCAQANCPVPLGACCLTSGSCIANRTPAQCNIIGGTWAGQGTTCPGACCPAPTGDINADGRVDAADIARFITAVLSTPAPSATEICKADFDHSGTLTTADIPGMVSALLTAP